MRAGCVAGVRLLALALGLAGLGWIGPGLARAEEPLSGEPPEVGGRTLVEFDTSIGILSRSLRFRDDLFGTTRDYHLGAAPVLTLDARLFPFTTLDVRGLRDLGVELDFDRPAVADSQRADGGVYPTSSIAWSLALQYRYLIARQILRASLGYGVHAFLIDPAGPASPTNDPTPSLPRVRYKHLRFSLGGDFAVAKKVIVYGRVSYLAVFDAGGIESDVWFPHARVTAMELQGGAGYRVLSWLELRVLLEYRRYGFDLRPEPGDRFIAGGAVDQYIQPTVGVALMR